MFYIEERVNEIKNSITAGGKLAYCKNEVLPELLALQEEMVALTFNQDHADLGNLKIWDVESHLFQINKEYGEVATEDLVRFQTGSHNLINLIKAEISGNRGESMTFQSLENMKSENLVIKNIELSDEIGRTEIDALVITPKGIFIIEVKNTKKNVIIDANGDYYRMGENMVRDSNIGRKLDVKANIVKKMLSNAGCEGIDIVKFVVFTNNRIEVKNYNNNINICFVNHLNHIIDEYEGGNDLSYEKMKAIESVLEAARCSESYPLKMDVEGFKTDFATAMAKLEAASQTELYVCNDTDNKLDEPVEEQVKQSKIKNITNKFLKSKKLKVVGVVAAVIAATPVATGILLGKADIDLPFKGTK